MTVEGAVNALRALLRGVTGINQVYDNPPESINVPIAGMAYIDTGDFVMNGQCIHTLIAAIYFGNPSLPEAIEQSKPFPDRVWSALKADPYLGGAVSHILTTLDHPVRYEGRASRYNGKDHFVLRFYVKVKIVDR